MVRSKIPDALKNLAEVGEMLTFWVSPVTQIYMKPIEGQRAYKDHIITLPNDVQKLADILSRYHKDIAPVVVFKFKDNISKELQVRRKNVEDALICNM